MNIIEWVLNSPLMASYFIVEFFTWLFTRRTAIECPTCKSWWRTSHDDTMSDREIWYCGRCKKAWTEWPNKH